MPSARWSSCPRPPPAPRPAIGWFRTPKTDALVGAGPLDTLGDAVAMIKREYQEAFGRGPSREDWEALLSMVLCTEDPDYRPIAKRIVVSVRLKTRPANPRRAESDGGE